MGTITELSESFVDEYAALDPVAAARSWGVGIDRDALTDYSPDGLAAREALLRRTARALRAAEPEGEPERLGRLYLLEDVESGLALVDAGEHERVVSALVGPQAAVRMAFDLMPRRTDEDWERVATRLTRVPGALAGYRRTLGEALRRGPAVPASTVEEVAAQCETWAGGGDGGWFARLAAGHGDGPHRARLDEAARQAAAAYGELAAWLRREVLPAAAAEDGVGPDRYAVWSRSMLGAAVDLDEAYRWGVDEVERLVAEQEAECERIRPGAGLAEVQRLLNEDPAHAVEGVDAFRDWLQSITDDAIERLHGREFDIPEPLRRCEVAIPPEGSAAAPYYTPPSEDLREPGRTWYPTLGRRRFPRWDLVTTAYHEAVPGHHLQLGMTRLVPLLRVHRVGFHSAHGEGWALYAELLMDELGFFDTPETRLGFLSSQAFRAVRIVVDIGLHTGRAVPDGWEGAGQRWDRGLAEHHLARVTGFREDFVASEVLRYVSWPAQATTYKLGERAWLEAREAARAAAGPDFDLRGWHARALALGALGLDDLRRELAAAAA